MLQQEIGRTKCPTKVAISSDIGKFWSAIVRWCYLQPSIVLSREFSFMYLKIIHSFSWGYNIWIWKKQFSRVPSPVWRGQQTPQVTDGVLQSYLMLYCVFFLLNADFKCSLFSRKWQVTATQSDIFNLSKNKTKKITEPGFQPLLICSYLACLAEKLRTCATQALGGLVRQIEEVLTCIDTIDIFSFSHFLKTQWNQQKNTHAIFLYFNSRWNCWNSGTLEESIDSHFSPKSLVPFLDRTKGPQKRALATFAFLHFISEKRNRNKANLKCRAIFYTWKQSLMWIFLRLF